LERHEYERLAAVEEQGWWFRGLRANLIAAWQRAASTSPLPALLDAGCGTGGLLARLAAARPEAHRFGIDLDPLAAATAQRKSGALIAIASTMALPFASDAFDAIFSIDVLGHKGVEAGPTLRSIHHCLKPGGVVILNLPAYRWLLSGHDRAVDNVRRFGRAEVEVLLASLGFAQIHTRYWNSLLFPLMVLQRLTHRHGASDVALFPGPVETLFHRVVRFEAWLNTRGWNLPFGGSILATAVKP
jgi:SAM-dependent methyltransferase